MGARGPAPVPTTLKVLRGSAKARRQRRCEPQPRVGAPSVPRWVRAQPEAAALWRHVVAVSPRGVLTVADSKMLELLCRSWVELLSDQAACLEQGRVLSLRDDTGMVRSVTAAPWAMRYTKLAVIVRGLLAEFGLSPSSRTRVSVAPAPAMDPTEVFLHGLSGGGQ